MKQAYVNGDCFPMARGGTLRIADGRGKLIHVWQGRLWLTQEGDRKDRYLEAGTSFRLDRRGTAIAYAANDAVVSFGAPAARGGKPLLAALSDLCNAFFNAWRQRRHASRLAELDERMLRDMGFEIEANLRRNARLSQRVEIY